MSRPKFADNAGDAEFSLVGMLGVLAGDAGDAAWERGGSFSMWGGSTCKLNEPPQVC